MTSNIEQMKTAALAAPPADMELYGDRYSQGCWSRADFTHEQDAFYRAANPAAVLELIAEVERLRAAMGGAEPVKQWRAKGDDAWFDLDMDDSSFGKESRHFEYRTLYTAPPAPVSAPAESEKGDIAGWLRRRQGNDLVMIPGRLAGEIADHIDKLAASVSAEPVCDPVIMRVIDEMRAKNTMDMTVRRWADELETSRAALYEDIYEQCCNLIQPIVDDERGMPGSVVEMLEILVERHKSAPPSTDAKDSGFRWDLFASYLLDKCEGATITEENLQAWTGEMVASDWYKERTSS